jgi:photosystem II stability/assembly factor-like uncharacterized protein
MLYYNGSSWVRGPDVNAPALRSVAFNSRGEGWAVGNRGAILRFRQGQWHPSPTSTPIPQTLYSVAFYHDHEVWAVGEGGTLLRCLS